MSKWMPIETAPKDGTVILGVRFKQYLGGGEVFTDGATMMWEGFGWGYTGHIVCIVPEDCAPTHWMPLPEPPDAT